MNIKNINTAIITFLLVCLFILDILFTSLYWQHLAVTHHAGRFECNSWGKSSFHWNDDSAQTPFQSPFIQTK